MSIPKANITPEVLSWARKRSAYSADEIAERLKSKKVSAETVRAWEQGGAQPSYTQLEKLADIYKRPVALFFLPSPPEEDDLRANFRSLPSDYKQSLSPKILYLVRTALARRIDLCEIHAGRAPDDIHNFRRRLGDIRLNNAKATAAKVRKIMGVSLENQWKRKNSDEALKMWRGKLEDLGVWVFKKAFGDDNYCGFYLHDENFPIIYLNNSVPSEERQIFTLFHELGHLLIAHGGIDFRQDVESKFSGRYRREEVFCNAFAGSFLVPDIDFPLSTVPDSEEIAKCAKKYKVSREVILRRCRDKHIVTQDFYDEKIDERHKQRNIGRQSGKKKRGGGNYYANQIAYLGNKYLTLAFRQYYQGRLNEYQLSDLLDGVKIQSLEGLEQFMLKE